MPTNMSMSDLLGSSLEAGNSVTNQALKMSEANNQTASTSSNMQVAQQKSVNDTAQSMADLQSKKLKQQEMQQQLVDTKYDSLTKRIQQQQNIQNPNTRKRVAEANDKVGLAHDGFFMDLHNDYKEDPQKNAALAKYLSGGKPSQEDMQNILSMVQDPTAAHQGFELIKNKLQGDAMAAAATIRGNATIEASKNRTGPSSPQAVRAEATINKNYENYMKPFEQTVTAVKSLSNTMNDIANGKLTDATNVKAEIESKMASVFGGGKPSTVYGQQAVSLDSYYGQYQHLLSKISGMPQGVLTEKQREQLNQELKTFGDNAAQAHEDAFLTHEDLVNPAYKDNIGQSYARFRQQKGLPSHIKYNGQQISEGKVVPQKTESAVPALSLEDRAKKGSINLEAARKKMTDEQIDAALKQKGL